MVVFPLMMLKTQIEEDDPRLAPDEKARFMILDDEKNDQS
jgi:hypothetical protein